jgi:hypothetical protein
MNNTDYNSYSNSNQNNYGGTPITQLRADLVEENDEVMQTQVNSGSKIKNLMNNINSDEALTYKKKQILALTDSESNTETDTEKKEVKKPKKDKRIKSTTVVKKTSRIPAYLQDPLLIWIIFIIMSQNFFKQLVGKYIPYINPDEDCKVGFFGVAIYGFLFAVLFMVIKFIINKFN